MGRLARVVARERFAIDRFARDWTAAFEDTIGRSPTAMRSYPAWSPTPGAAARFTSTSNPPAAFGDAR
jgi:hypothetical protein